VLYVDCEAVGALLTGDVTEGAQEGLIDEYGAALAAEIVKVPHHGSPDRSSDFPSFVQAEYAVFSYGTDNPYGHPNANVVQEWEDVGAAIYKTAEDGDVTFLIKNGNITVTTER